MQAEKSQMMLKVIRFDKNEYQGGEYNNAFKINNELALAEGLSIFDYIPKRKAYRKHIIKLCNSNPNIVAPVSHKDIKRLERADKCELPINAVDILETLVTEIEKMRDNFNYRAHDNYIISCHILQYTLEALTNFCMWLDAHEVGVRPECDKFRNEVEYIKERLRKFDEKHSGTFNSIFE